MVCVIGGHGKGGGCGMVNHTSLVSECGVCVAVVHPQSPKCVECCCGGEEGFGGEPRRSEKRKSKKGGARKSGKKGETQIHFQKNTHKKKQKAQLTLAD